MPESFYDRDFPKLRATGYRRTSEPHWHNCIAYAAGDFERKWCPDEHPPRSRSYWPEGVRRDSDAVEVFIEAFATLGYQPCADGSWEPGFEKVAFYALRGDVQHAARQQPDGTWRSKLGDEEDIEHTLDGLEGRAYGSVVAFVRRPISGFVGRKSRLTRLREWFRNQFRR